MTKTHFEGLSSKDAARLLAEFGPNALPQEPPPSVVAIILRTLREPMFLLLALAAILYLAVGDLGEGLFMVAGAAATISLVVIQEARTERAVRALRELAEPMAHVLRDGAQKRIPARDLVPGDIVLVSEGERAPADALLIAGDALVVDESILTGESAPVAKTLGRNAAADMPDPGGEDTPFLYSGAMIVRGAAVARVLRTGARTAIGGVGASLATIESAPSPLQQTTGALVARLGAFALFFCALVTVAYGLVHRDWIEGVFAGITLAISLLPEEFPMVLAIFLALGAWRLAQRNVLVRRSAATETLGSASMLCVDKTGTLTQNRMTLTELFTGREAIPAAAPLSGEAWRLLHAALHACATNPVDPMDRAVHALAAEAALRIEGEPLESFPIRPERLAFIQRWRIGDERHFFAKGAPEAVFRLAHANEDLRMSYRREIDRLAQRGLRVLAVAQSTADAAQPEGAHFDILGLLAFADPIRDEVPQAVAEARRAGVAVAMITGDYPETALAIAREAGIDTRSGSLLGADIAEGLPEKIRDVRVFARVTPNAKLAIIDAFKADGHIVAMTGDGVNDGPALAAAHIGIAMGQRGSDVAREAASIVLLDDRFASIVSGIQLGRRIFANLRKALIYITAIHVPIAGLALAPILLGLPPLLLPAHVVLMELIIDPICSLAFESQPGEPDAMQKPPRRADESLFGASEMQLALAQGVVVFLSVLSVYVTLTGLGASEPQARGLAFAALIAANLVLALSDALPKGVSFFSRGNKPFLIIAAAASAMIAATLYAPPLAALLRFEAPGPIGLAYALSLALIAGGWYGAGRRLLDM